MKGTSNVEAEPEKPMNMGNPRRQGGLRGGRGAEIIVISSDESHTEAQSSTRRSSGMCRPDRIPSSQNSVEAARDPRSSAGRPSHPPGSKREQLEAGLEGSDRPIEWSPTPERTLGRSADKNRRKKADKVKSKEKRKEIDERWQVAEPEPELDLLPGQDIFLLDTYANLEKLK